MIFFKHVMSEDVGCRDRLKRWVKNFIFARSQTSIYFLMQRVKGRSKFQVPVSIKGKLMI